MIQNLITLVTIQFVAIIATVIILSRKGFKTYVLRTFPEYTGQPLSRSLDFSYIEHYIHANPNCCIAMKSNKNTSTNEVFTVAEKKPVTLDEFEGAEFCWNLVETPQEDRKRYFRLTSNRGHSQDIITRYLTHVLSQGKSPTLEDKGKVAVCS